MIDTGAILLLLVLLSFHCVRDSKYLTLPHNHNTLKRYQVKAENSAPVSKHFHIFLSVRIYVIVLS